jgi:hypothetical protein
LNQTPAWHQEKYSKTTITKAGKATMMDSVKRSTYDLKAIYFESNSCMASGKMLKNNNCKSWDSNHHGFSKTLNV